MRAYRALCGGRLVAVRDSPGRRTAHGPTAVAVQTKLVSLLLLQHCVLPALAAPQQFGINCGLVVSDAEESPDDGAPDYLINIAETLQALVDELTFDTDTLHSDALNAFSDKNRPLLQQFVADALVRMRAGPPLRSAHDAIVLFGATECRAQVMAGAVGTSAVIPLPDEAVLHANGTLARYLHRLVDVFQAGLRDCAADPPECRIGNVTINQTVVDIFKSIGDQATLVSEQSIEKNQPTNLRPSLVRLPRPHQIDDLGTMRPPLEWDINDVGQWLNAVGFHQFIESFATNGIDGYKMLRLGLREMRALGIERIALQRKLLLLIAKMNAEARGAAR